MGVKAAPVATHRLPQPAKEEDMGDLEARLGALKA